MCETPEHFGEPVIMQPETQLYEPLSNFLYSGFHAQFQPKFGSWRIIVQDTSDVPDPLGGQWTRPDLSAVGISRRKYSPEPTIDVMSFEVKTFETGAQLSAVHETLAHTRFVNFAYLVWNRPFCVCNDRSYETIRANCEIYGLGLITAHNPGDLKTWTIRCSPTRSAVSEDQIDEFIESRFNPANQARIVDALRYYCREKP